MRKQVDGARRKDVHMDNFEELYIAALYRVILQRDPDLLGFIKHVKEAKELGSPDFIESKLNQFIVSEEAQAITTGRLIYI